MRAGFAFAALLVTAAFLAGCVSHVDDLTTSSNGGSPPTVTSPAAPKLTVLAPLTTTITASGADWMKAGDSMTVTAALPANAQAPVTFEWMIGPIAGVGPYPKFSGPAVTPVIRPGESSAVKFDQAGIFHEHCHPHPWMLSNVTVVDDGRAPQTVTVHFVDGASQGDFRFVPSEVTIPKGSTVIYQNDGAQPHQTMLLHQDSPLKMLPLTAASGDVKLEGNGWTRVIVAMTDAAGRVGYAEKDVYVTAELPAPLVKKYSGGFPAGAPSSTPGAVDDQTPMDSQSFAPERAGTLYLNYSAKDALNAASGGATPNTASIDLHLKQSGQKQDVLTVDSNDGGTLKARVDAVSYILTVKPRGGVNLTYEALITVVYDLVPPPKPTPYADLASDAQSMPGMVM